MTQLVFAQKEITYVVGTKQKIFNFFGRLNGEAALAPVVFLLFLSGCKAGKLHIVES